MTEKVDYGSRKFGDFRSIGNSPNDFIDRPVQERVFLAARSHLCPIPEEVIDSYTARYIKNFAKGGETLPDAEIGGMRMAISRYTECNFTMKEIILHSVKEKNPTLYKNLVTPLPRIPGEEFNQNLKPNYIPKDFSQRMRLASTVYGYALPRILIVQFGENRDESDVRSQERILKGLYLLDKLIPKYNDPIEFTVKLAEEVSKLDANPNRVIYHLFSMGILQEQGCKDMFKKTFSTLEKKAPNLWSTYQKLLQEKGESALADMGIITPSYLK